MELVIGTKAWSTWSMRAWLTLRRTGAPFAETLVALRQPDGATRAAIAAHSPSGRAPALKVEGATIWDSLAICEWLAERHPSLWPGDPIARGLARSAAAEMHSGFHSLRNECPMDLGAGPRRATLSQATQEDIRRIVDLWRDLLGRFGGPFLVGGWSIADAFYTPVATRFRTYGVRLADYGDDGPAEAYAERLLCSPEYLEWEQAAIAPR